MKNKIIASVLFVIILNFCLIALFLPRPKVSGVKIPHLSNKIHAPREEPHWLEYKSCKKFEHQSKTLSDIESHMDYSQVHFGGGFIYRDKDLITWAHESTHGINGVLRTLYAYNNTIYAYKPTAIAKVPANPGRSSNCFYCLNDRFIMLKEPSTTTIAMVRNNIPKSLEGNSYRLYMIQQAKSWNDQPLYICDEWIAYTHGAMVTKECREKGINVRPGGGGEYEFMLEHMGYVFVLSMTIKEHDPDYIDWKNFKLFVKWNAERCVNINKNSNFYDKLKANDCAKIRTFCQKEFGEEWYRNTLKL